MMIFYTSILVYGIYTLLLVQGGIVTASTSSNTRYLLYSSSSPSSHPSYDANAGNWIINGDNDNNLGLRVHSTNNLPSTTTLNTTGIQSLGIEWLWRSHHTQNNVKRYLDNGLGYDDIPTFAIYAKLSNGTNTDIPNRICTFISTTFFGKNELCCGSEETFCNLDTQIPFIIKYNLHDNVLLFHHTESLSNNIRKSFYKKWIALHSNLNSDCFTNKNTKWTVNAAQITINNSGEFTSIIDLSNPTISNSCTLPGKPTQFISDKDFINSQQPQQNLTLSVAPSRGHHPTLHLTIPQSQELTIILPIPFTLISDPHQLEDKSNKSIHYQVFGKMDLETPANVGASKPAFTVVNVKSNSVSKVELPLHTRYQAPRNSSNGYVDLVLPKPVVLTRKTSKSKIDAFSIIPLMLSFLLNITEPVEFLPITESSERVLKVPVGYLQHLWIVEKGTLLITLLAAVGIAILVLVR